MVEDIYLHSSVLLNIACDISRGPSAQFGVFLGTINSNKVIVENSFDIILRDQVYINEEFFLRRLEQYNAISSELEMVGMYHLTNNLDHNPLTESIVEQVSRLHNIPHMTYTLIDGPKLQRGEELREKAIFRTYMNKNIVPTFIILSSTESIATLTAYKHSNYLKQDARVTRRDASETVLDLQKKLQRIIEHLEKSNASELVDHHVLNKVINRLANKVTAFKSQQAKGNGNYELQTSRLGILTEQLTVLEELKTKIDLSILRHVVGPNSQSGFNHSQYNVGGPYPSRS